MRGPCRIWTGGCACVWPAYGPKATSLLGDAERALCAASAGRRVADRVLLWAPGCTAAHGLLKHASFRGFPGDGQRAPGRGRDAGIERKCVATAGALHITPMRNCKTCVRGMNPSNYVILWREGAAPTCTCR